MVLKDLKEIKGAECKLMDGFTQTEITDDVCQASGDGSPTGVLRLPRVSGLRGELCNACVILVSHVPRKSEYALKLTETSEFSPSDYR